MADITDLNGWFSRLANKGARKLWVRETPAAAKPTPLEQAEDELRSFGDTAFQSLSLVLSALQAQAEAEEDIAIGNQPVMLVCHGRAKAFKELKAKLDSLRQAGSSARAPQED